MPPGHFGRSCFVGFFCCLLLLLERSCWQSNRSVGSSSPFPLLMLQHVISSDTAVTPNRMHPAAWGRRRRGWYSTQGKPSERRGSTAGLRQDKTKKRTEKWKGKRAGLYLISSLSVCAHMYVNSGFQSRAPNNGDSGDEGKRYEAQGIPSRKNPVKCMHRITAAPSNCFQPHLHTSSLYLSEHRATPKCYHFILTTLTSHPAFPA